MKSSIRKFLLINLLLAITITTTLTAIGNYYLDQKDIQDHLDTLMAVSALSYQALLGDDLGGLGAVGVAASERGRGIGLALVAGASELLKARGIGHSYIDWTTLVNFYGHLGYAPWREYQMSERRRVSNPAVIDRVSGTS